MTLHWMIGCLCINSVAINVKIINAWIIRNLEQNKYKISSYDHRNHICV